MLWKGLDGICDFKGDECQRHNDCEDDNKCCFNGCQKECAKVPSEKYGKAKFHSNNGLYLFGPNYVQKLLKS